MMPRSDMPQLGHNGGPLLDDLLSMTIKRAALVTGFSKDCIYGLIRDGEVESFLMGSRRYLVASSLRAYLTRRAAEPLTIRRSPRPRHGRSVGPADQPFTKT
jgi:excisionase family DNA binding protein